MRRPGRDSSDSLISSHLRPLFGKWFSVWWIIDDSKQYKMVVGVDLIGNTDSIANYNAGMLSVLQEVLPRPNEYIIFQMQFKKTVKSWIPMLYFPRKPQTNSFFNFLLSSPVLPLQGCRTWSEIPRVSRQLEQHKNVKASKCNWESTKPCQGVRRAEKPMNIVMKKTSENKPDGFFLFKRSSGLMRVQFHNYAKSTQADGEKTPTKHNNPLTQTLFKLIIYHNSSVSCQAGTKGRWFSQGHDESKIGNKHFNTC